jgi:hypothetical protein
MKLNKSFWLAAAILIIVGAVSRLLSLSVAGVAPQMALALFGGAVIKDKKWAFALPLFSLLLSDTIMEFMSIPDRPGFYEGQWAVYLCFAVITLYGFLLKKINFGKVLFFSISGSLFFFLLSNFFVWAGHGGLQRPMTFDGLLLCYWDGLAYYRDRGLINGFIANQALGDLIWSVAIFGIYYLVNRFSFEPKREMVAEKI